MTVFRTATRALLNAIHRYPMLVHRTALVEHPPQHFVYDADGNGDYEHTRSTQVCGCLAHEFVGAPGGKPTVVAPETSQVFRSNQIMLEEANNASISVLRMFDSFLAWGCLQHQRPGKDCTHFRRSPAIWAPFIEAVVAMGPPGLLRKRGGPLIVCF